MTMHTELYCDRLEKLDAVKAIRVIHQCYLQLAATQDKALAGGFDNAPAMARCAAILKACGHPGFA